MDNQQLSIGLEKTQQLLKGTIVTHSQGGITVVVDAQPEIISLSFDENTSLDPETIVKVINQGIAKAKHELISKVSQEFPPRQLD